jgi:NDP-mannose synthase
MSKRAVVLAGGKGTRLKPYTITLPKPLVPVGDDMPVLEIIIRQLRSHGFDHITLAVNHMSEIIKAFFGDGSKWDIKIDYSEESKPLGTMGPLKNIIDLPENFLVMNGDIITDLDYGSFHAVHSKGKFIFTISSFERNEQVDYGVITSEKGLLKELSEKPLIKYEVSMGVYMLSKKVLDFIPKNKEFGFDQLMYKLLKNDKKVSVKKHKKYWLDIGRPSDYQIAINDYESKIKKDLL